MVVSSVTGQPGDIVLLTSPIQLFSQSSLITFNYALLSNTSDTQASLSLSLNTPLGVPVMHKLIATSAAASSVWQTAEWCIPQGTYSLVFKAIHGQPLLTAIMVDNVQVSNLPCQPSIDGVISIPGTLCNIYNNVFIHTIKYGQYKQKNVHY